MWRQRAKNLYIQEMMVSLVLWNSELSSEAGIYKMKLEGVGNNGQ